MAVPAVGLRMHSLKGKSSCFVIKIRETADRFPTALLMTVAACNSYCAVGPHISASLRTGKYTVNARNGERQKQNNKKPNPRRKFASDRAEGK
jgi:hypothetical protein